MPLEFVGIKPLADKELATLHWISDLRFPGVNWYKRPNPAGRLAAKQTLTLMGASEVCVLLERNDGAHHRIKRAFHCRKS
jgi:hypothetical protein